MISGVDTFRYAESTIIDVPADVVYDLVTDIGRTGEWSPVCRECWWQDGQEARAGAWFNGRNEADGVIWETDAQVEVADRGREFAWLIGGKYARWSYGFDALSARRTQLTESWEFLPAGRAMFRDKYGLAADARIELRRRQAVDGIPATLAAVKRIAEAEWPD